MFTSFINMTDNTGREHVHAQEAMDTICLPPCLLSSAATRDIKQSARGNLDGLPGRGFRVSKLLSASECAELVKLAEGKGFREVSWEYNKVHLLCK